MYNIGYIGKGKYTYKHEAYKKWICMIERCYSRVYQKNFKSYEGSIVCEEWHDFQNFAKWYDENKVDGWHLDKDLLSDGSKVYSPNTCCFLPSKINALIVNKRNGLYMKGICLKNGKYQVTTCRIYIGCFDTEEEAISAYKVAKKSILVSIALQNKSKLKPLVLKKIIAYEI